MPNNFKQKIKVMSDKIELKLNNEMSLEQSLEDHKDNFEMMRIFSTKDKNFFVPDETLINVTAGVFNNGKIINGKISSNKQKGNYLILGVEGKIHELEEEATNFDYKNKRMKDVFAEVAKKFKLKLIWKSEINDKITRSDIMGSDSSSTGGDNVTGTGKPSCSFCGSKLSYKNYTSTFKNQCGNCKKTGVLQDNPKGTAEGEWTCSACDSDFCKVCGKEKIDPARSWLTQVSVPDAVKK